ncbi:hypothetical protein AVEN_225797-1 [Araneus ventricosus]|uniref:Uncharacterized protein n=1 Tax=Araneus ventricosus TaxID=182803 RepID=A0A4Y2BB34_ARAVE|nr:hypothetical protein AVEN_225797-1 [Araneus ventricosus]
MEYEIHSTTKAVKITLHIRDSIACVYDEQCWLAEVNDISDINKDVLVAFYHPIGPRTVFKKQRKTSLPLFHTTTTGRTHHISPKLSEEISKLLNECKSR